MENETHNNAEVAFRDGFNDGYILQKFGPDLGQVFEEQLVHQSGSAYTQGLASGREEYMLEQRRDKLQEYLKTSPGYSQDKGKERDQSMER